MTTVRIQERASSRLDEIYCYTPLSEWGAQQALPMKIKGGSGGPLRIVGYKP